MNNYSVTIKKDGKVIMEVLFNKENINTTLDYIGGFKDVTFIGDNITRRVTGNKNPIPYLRFISVLPDSYVGEINYLFSRYINDNYYNETVEELAERLGKTQVYEMIKPFYFQA